MPAYSRMSGAMARRHSVQRNKSSAWHDEPSADTTGTNASYLMKHGKVSRQAVVDLLTREMQVKLSYHIQSFTTAQISDAMVSWTLPNTSTAANLPSVSDAMRAGRRLRVVGPDGKTVTDQSSSGDGLNSVKTLPGVYDWIESTIIALAWRDAINGTSFISNFNRVIGGCRLQQRRLARADCPGSDAMKDYFKSVCYSRSGKPNKTRNSMTLASFRDDGDSHTYWLDINQNETQALEHLYYLKSANWLSPATDRIKVQLVLYNDQVALFAFVEVTFLLQRSGQLTPKPVVKVVPTEVYNSAMAIIGDILMVTLLSWLALGETLSLYQAWQRGDLASYFKDWYFKALNWILFWLGIGLVIFYSWLAVKIGDVDEDVSGVPLPPDATDYAPGTTVWNDRHSRLDHLFSEVSKIVDYINFAECMTFWYVIVIVFKFFEAFSANPRLAIITETFWRACADLLHFLIVFMSIFLNFALGAYVMFGNQLAEWSNPGLCITTSFRALMGDFDFSGMYAVAPVSAVIWFVCFMTLIFIVMLNMLLAIVMDIYCDVKDESSAQMSLLKQLQLMVVGAKLQLSQMKKGQIQSYESLRAMLDMHADKAEVDVPSLAQMGMSEEFAVRVIEHLHKEIQTKRSSIRQSAVEGSRGELDKAGVKRPSAVLSARDKFLAQRHSANRTPSELGPKDSHLHTPLRSAGLSTTVSALAPGVLGSWKVAQTEEVPDIPPSGNASAASRPGAIRPMNSPPPLAVEQDDGLRSVVVDARELVSRAEEIVSRPVPRPVLRRKDLDESV